MAAACGCYPGVLLVRPCGCSFRLQMVLLWFCAVVFMMSYWKTAELQLTDNNNNNNNIAKVVHYYQHDNHHHEVVLDAPWTTHQINQRHEAKEQPPPHHQIHHQQQLNPSTWSSVDFVAQFGTGHRLNRLSVANFIAEHLGFGLRTFWGFCRPNATLQGDAAAGKDVEIFSHLFGTEPLRDWTTLVNNSSSSTSSHHHHNLLLVNKIRKGFYYLHRRDVTQLRAFRRRNLTLAMIHNMTNHSLCACRSPPAQAKIKADVQLYRTLRERFRATPTRVQAVRETYFQQACLVIGLHVRAGNGEANDFSSRHRYIDMNVTEWVVRVAHHVQSLVYQWGRGGNHTRRRKFCNPLDASSASSPSSAHHILFLATDTPSMIHQFKSIFEKDQDSIRVVELDQNRKANGSGVWFGDEHLHERGDKCLTSWEDSFADMILLSYADIVVASRLSTYTQTIPMSLAFAARQEEEEEEELARLAATTTPSATVQQSHHRKIQARAAVASALLPPAYCEMNRDASDMQCYRSFMDWCCVGTSRWGADSIELPNADFFNVSYFNATPRPMNLSECDPKSETFSCLPFQYTT